MNQNHAFNPLLGKWCLPISMLLIFEQRKLPRDSLMCGPQRAGPIHLCNKWLLAVYFAQNEKRDPAVTDLEPPPSPPLQMCVCEPGIHFQAPLWIVIPREKALCVLVRDNGEIQPMQEVTPNSSCRSLWHQSCFEGWEGVIPGEGVSEGISHLSQRHKGDFRWLAGGGEWAIRRGKGRENDRASVTS
jgi:hypothetical protein